MLGARAENRTSLSTPQGQEQTQQPLSSHAASELHETQDKPDPLQRQRPFFPDVGLDVSCCGRTEVGTPWEVGTTTGGGMTRERMLRPGAVCKYVLE